MSIARAIGESGSPLPSPGILSPPRCLCSCRCTSSSAPSRRARAIPPSARDSSRSASPFSFTGGAAQRMYVSRMIRPRISLAVFAALAALVSPLSAQHDHLGRVVFPTSCNATAQPRFEHAMALLHSFWWEEGQGAFESVSAADSTCAMGYWGLALNAWGNPFAGGPGGFAGKGSGLQRGANFAARAVALGAPTPREQGFIAAAAALYRGADSIPNSQR